MLLILLIVLLVLGVGGGFAFHPLWVLAAIAVVAIIYDRTGRRRV